jgi:hypothetical protein
LATGGKWLNEMQVLRKCNVGVMSGENGPGSLQDVALRVCASKGLSLAEIESLVWCDDLPQFDSKGDLVALKHWILDNNLEVVIIDPAYLAMPGADAGNMFVQGPLLRAVSKVCKDNGAMLVLVHHVTGTAGKSKDPLELSDIAWAGFKEFAAQWWLVNRRERYAEGSGEHRLWLSIGGRAGHSGLWGVDVNEGVRCDLAERRWDVSVFSGGAATGADAERQDSRNLEHDTSAIRVVLSAAKGPETKSNIRTLAKIRNSTRLDTAIDHLLLHKEIVPAKVDRGNKQSYDGFVLREYATSA